MAQDENLKSEWFEIVLTDEDILRLNDMERYVVLLGGHIVNELYGHIKLALSIGNETPSNIFAAAHYTTISNYLIFVGSGKIKEAWRVIEDVTKQTSFQNDFGAYLGPVGRDALAKLREYFQNFKDTSITKTRNSVGFHYPNRKEFSEFLGGPNVNLDNSFRVLLADQEINNNYISSSHVLYQFAGAQTNDTSPHDGLKTIVDDQVRIITLLCRLINELIVVVLRARFRAKFQGALSSPRSHEIEPNTMKIALPIMAVSQFAVPNPSE